MRIVNRRITKKSLAAFPAGYAIGFIGTLIAQGMFRVVQEIRFMLVGEAWYPRLSYILEDAAANGMVFAVLSGAAVLVVSTLEDCTNKDGGAE